MKKIKENYKLFILLYIFWILLTLDFNISNLIIGMISSILVTVASYEVIYDKYGYKFHLPNPLKLIRYSLNLLIEIYLSSFSYIMRIIKKDFDPVFVEVKLTTKNPLIITIIANSITLTPGTLTVDADENKLIVLSINDPSKNGKDLSKYITEKFEKQFL